MRDAKTFSPVVRYGVWRSDGNDKVAVMVEDTDGGWVGYGDYLALRAQLAALQAFKPSGDAQLDAILGQPDPEFTAMRDSLPPNYWARYDLSAVRLGWHFGRADLKAQVSEAERQEPVGVIRDEAPVMTCLDVLPEGTKLYARPVPAAVPDGWKEAARNAKKITANVCRDYPETAVAHINGLADLLLAAAQEVSK